MYTYTYTRVINLQLNVSNSFLKLGHSPFNYAKYEKHYNYNTKYYSHYNFY